MRDGDKETRIECPFGGKTDRGGDVSLYAERGGRIGGEGEVNAGMRERASFACVIEILDEGGERVQFW